MSIVPTGYPDFSRRAARSDELLFDDEMGPGGNTMTTNALAVGGSSALGVNIFGLSGNMKYVIGWYLDDQFNTQLTTQQIHVMSASEFRGSIPCLGPFVDFTVTNSGGLDDHQVTLWTAWQPGPHSLEIGNSQIAVHNGVNVGAGASVTDNADFIWPGTAILNIRTALATFRVEVRARRYDGSTFTIGWWNQSGGLSQTHTIALPMNCISLIAYNDTAAAGLMYVYLQAASYGPIT